MIEDFVRSNGYLTLGTRLKRLGERMQNDVADISTELGMPTSAGLWTALGAVVQNGSLTIGGLAEALGVSQPAATKLTARLVQSGLIELMQDSTDKRTRTLVARPTGTSLVETGQKRFWPAVEAAVRDLCGDASTSLIDKLDAIEADLSVMSLAERIRQKLQEGETHGNAS